MKKKLFTIACVLAITGVFVSCVWATGRSTFKITTYVDYAFDINDPKAMAGHADYVFVGYVTKQNAVEYEDVSSNFHVLIGPYQTGQALMNYDITVRKNLKGNLKLQEPLPMRKLGTTTLIGGTVPMNLEEGDALPNEGNSYIFYVVATQDGGLQINGKNSNVPLETITPAKTANKSPAAIAKLEDAELAKIEALPLYKEIVQACKNEIPYERERMTVPAEWLEDSAN